MLAFVLRNKYALINLVLWVVFAYLVYLIGHWALPFVLPLVFGSLIAILIEPIVKLLTRVKFPRWLASVVTLLVFLGGGTALLLLLVARMTLELADFAKSVPGMTSGLVVRGQEMLDKAVAFYGTLSPTMSAKVQDYLSQVSNALADIGKTTATSVLHGIQAVPSMLTLLLLSLLISFFLSKDFPKWQRRILRLVNPSIREKGDVVLDDLGKATFGYVRAQAILIFITFVISLIGLLILHVPYAFSLSILAGLLDMVPLFGTGSLFVPWSIYMFVMGDTRLGFGLLIVYGIGLVARQLLEPKILAESIGADPLITLVTMYAGYQAIGFPGIMLAPFLIIFITSMLKVHAFDFLIDDPANPKPPTDA